MMDDYKIAAFLYESLNINVVETLYLGDCLQKKTLSWSYAPANVRYSLQRLIGMRFLEIVDKTFEDDPQIYKFVVLGDMGREWLGKMLKNE